MEKKKIIFILSAGRSGSTLVDKLIGSSVNCFSLGEIGLSNDYFERNVICSCGEYLNKCPFWSKIDKEFDFKSDTNIQLSYHYSSKFLKYINFLRVLTYLVFNINILPKNILNSLQNTKKLYFSISNNLNENIFIDSSKNVLRALLLTKFLKNNFDFDYLFLIRSGLGNLNSRLKSKFTLKNKKNIDIVYGARNVKRFTPKKAIKNWKKTNYNILILLYLFNKKHITVSYDEMVNDPKNYVKYNIFKKLGIEFKNEYLNFNLHSYHMIGGNSSRVNATTVNKIINPKLDNITKKLKLYYLKKTFIIRRLFSFLLNLDIT